MRFSSSVDGAGNGIPINWTRFDNRHTTTTTNYSAQLTQGTTSPSSSSHVVSVPGPEPKMWLYVSRIDPDVTNEQVTELAKSCLGSDEIVAFKLIKKDTETTNMRSVSFKIGLPCSLRSKALEPSTWPRGIYFREFKTDHRHPSVFWKPTVTQRPPTPQTASPNPEGPRKRTRTDLNATMSSIDCITIQ